MSKPVWMPDVNVLLALMDRDHVNHQKAAAWFATVGKASFALCVITESGFVRLAASPQLQGLEMRVAIALLDEIAALPNCIDLPIQQSWRELVRPLTAQLQGYRQVTDALLLGVAIAHNAVLVTFDQGLKALAGKRYAGHVLTLV